MDGQLGFGRRVGACFVVVALTVTTAGAVEAAGAGIAAASAATRRVIVRPVTAAGHAAKGYRVRTESRSVSCSAASAGAVNAGIAYCGSSADYTVACWQAAGGNRVLCLPDPTSKRLESVVLDGAFPRVRAPKHPSPQAVVVGAGKTYLVRDGGAADKLRQHPTWHAFYYAGGKGAASAIYGRGADGINRRHALWFVTTFASGTAKGVRRDVGSAYFVGTEY